jgi:NAD(P)-dependent dehydrogenase (short-subunit alcohol dehydrogenase family)
MLLKNKIAIITGAGGGIGSTIAKTFAKEGCGVILVDCLKSSLDRVSKELEKYNCEFLAITADACNKKEVDNAADVALKKFSKIDILVNTAGIQGPIGPFVNNNINKWIETINVNLNGTVLFIKAVLPTMMKQGWGKIINFSGGGAFNPRPNFSAYATSKAAVVRLTETLAEELKEYNIQANAISPGAVNTKMLEEVLETGPETAGAEFYEKAKKQKEEGGDSPQLAADLVLFLSSEKSYNLSGKTISAKWDNWRDWNKEEISKIMSSDLYTLRRII